MYIGRVLKDNKHRSAGNVPIVSKIKVIQKPRLRHVSKAIPSGQWL